MLEDSKIAQMEERFFELVGMAEQRQAEDELLRTVGRDRLVELAQAEKDGRLVVLPCRKDMLGSCQMRHADNCFPSGGFCCPDTEVCRALHYAYDMGKFSVTRQEAEAAVEKGANT